MRRGLGRKEVVAADGVFNIAAPIKASRAGHSRDWYDGAVPWRRKEKRHRGANDRRKHDIVRISRRRCWWYTSLGSFDKEFSVADHLQVKLMMECGGMFVVCWLFGLVVSLVQVVSR